MGIFSRLGDIINSNLNSLLDRAENPEKMLNNIIQEMEDTLVELRTSAARAIADRKQIVRKLSLASEEQTDWQQKAELALSKEREDLAKAALVEKSNLEEIKQQLNHQLTFIEEDIEKYNEDIAHLNQKLKDARAKAQHYQSRIKSTEHQLKVRETASNDRLNRITSQLEQFEQKMDYKEAEVESYNLGKPRNLKQEINSLEAEDKVQKELDELKKNLSTKHLGDSK